MSVLTRPFNLIPSHLSVTYKDVERLCREKIRRAKAQCELNLPTAVKDNKKCFCKYTGNKRRAKENPHPSVDAGEKQMDKGSGKDWGTSLNYSLTENKTTCCLGSQSPEMEDREQNEASIIQREMSSDLLHLLDTDLDWIHPRPLRELEQLLTKPVSSFPCSPGSLGRSQLTWRCSGLVMDSILKVFSNLSSSVIHLGQGI